MAREHAGCLSTAGFLIIIGLVAAGINNCTNHLFGGGGGSNHPKTHQVAKKHKAKKKGMHLILYNNYFDIKKKIHLLSNKTYQVNGVKCTILKAYQLPLKDETGFTYDPHHSAKFMANCLYRVWIKVQVPGQDNSKLGAATLDVGHGHVSKSYVGGSDSEFRTTNMEEYSNAEYLFGNYASHKPQTAILHVPITATRKGQVVKQVTWTVRLPVR